MAYDKILSKAVYSVGNLESFVFAFSPNIDMSHKTKTMKNFDSETTKFVSNKFVPMLLKVRCQTLNILNNNDDNNTFTKYKR